VGANFGRTGRREEGPRPVPKKIRKKTSREKFYERTGGRGRKRKSEKKMRDKVSMGT